MLGNYFCVSLYILNCCSGVLDLLKQLTTAKHSSSSFSGKEKPDCTACLWNMEQTNAHGLPDSMKALPRLSHTTSDGALGESCL